MTHRISRSDIAMTSAKFPMIACLTLDDVNTVLGYNIMGAVNTNNCNSDIGLYHPPTRDQKVWWDQVWHTMIDDRIDRMTISLPSNRTDYRTNSVSVYRGIFTYQR